jgi:hypothetical protein
MRKTFVSMSKAWLVLCCLVVAVSAQQIPSRQNKAVTPLLNDKPTIYITFETADETQKAIVWLRLHNNTAAKITLEQRL